MRTLFLFLISVFPSLVLGQTTSYSIVTPAPTMNPDVDLSESVRVAASSLSIKVSGIYLYTSPLCTGTRVTAFESSVPLTLNLVTAQEKIFGSVAAGTYSCLVLKIDSTISATPSRDLGPCYTAQPVNFNLFSAANYFSGTVKADTIMNTLLSPSDANQQVYVWYSTASKASVASAALLNRPKTNPDAVNGLPFTGVVIGSGAKLAVKVSHASKDYLGTYYEDPKCVFFGFPNLTFTSVQQY